MRVSSPKEIALLVLSILLSLGALEAALRFLTEPSDHAFATLFGHELPPLEVVLDQPPSTANQSAPYDDLRVDGQQITLGDMCGLMRPDTLSGYAPQESAISKNGWWQSNALGARARVEAQPQVPARKTRVLIFGESFANGSGLPQDETWPAILQRLNPQLEVLNFAVDGYSMAQAYLHYQQVAAKVEFDRVLLVFVPAADLWRDINVLRHLGEEGWQLNFVQPRFVIDEGTLELAKSPYASPAEYWQHNRDGVTPELEQHLRLYDRFYYPAKYREPTLAGRSILWRMITRIRFDRRRNGLRNAVYESDSEAVQVSKGIFREMRERILSRGSDMDLIILPTDANMRQIAESPSFQRTWRDMVATVCADDLPCIDLSSDMARWPPDSMDRAFDGSHFGPLANQRLAETLDEHLFAASNSPASELEPELDPAEAH